MSQNSLYKTFSVLGFRHAPVTKTLILVQILGSFFMVLFPRYKKNLLMIYSDLFSWKYAYRWLIGRLFFTYIQDAISGCCLLYCIRSVERRYGSRKFFALLLTSTLIDYALQLLLLASLQFHNMELLTRIYPVGPHHLLFACLTIFLLDVPYLPVGKIWRLPLTAKQIPVLLALQLFLSDRITMLFHICGFLSGILYASNFLECNYWITVPETLSKSVETLFAFFIDLGEDAQGTVLPIGATIEIQRQMIFDSIEQQLMSRFQHADADGRAVESLNVSESNIQALQDMGFSNRQLIVDALRSTNGDINAAANLLVQRGQL